MEAPCSSLNDWANPMSKIELVAKAWVGYLFYYLSHFPHPSEIFGIRDEGTYCLEIRRMHVSKRKTGAILREFIRPTDPCLKVYKSKVSLFCRSICLIQNNDQEFGRNKSFIEFFILVVRK